MRCMKVPFLLIWLPVSCCSQPQTRSTPCFSGYKLPLECPSELFAFAAQVTWSSRHSVLSASFWLQSGDTWLRLEMEGQNLKTPSQQFNIPIVRTLSGNQIMLEHYLPSHEGTGEQWSTEGENTVLYTSVPTHIWVTCRCKMLTQTGSGRFLQQLREFFF